VSLRPLLMASTGLAVLDVNHKSHSLQSCRHMQLAARIENVHDVHVLALLVVCGATNKTAKISPQVTACSKM
jgi:hypothetical protein